jgi:hypothetical protein
MPHLDFVRNRYHKLEYICGQMDVWEKIYPNLYVIWISLTWYITMASITMLKKNQLMEVDYGFDLDLGLTLLGNDRHIIKMFEGVRNGSEVELNFQHSIVEDLEFVEIIEEEMTMLDKVIESTTNLIVGNQFF